MPAQIATLSLTDSQDTPVTHAFQARGVQPNVKTGELVAEWTDADHNGGSQYGPYRIRLYQSQSKDGKLRYRCHVAIPQTTTVNGVLTIADQDDAIIEWRFGKGATDVRRKVLCGLVKSIANSSSSGTPGGAALNASILTS